MIGAVKRLMTITLLISGLRMAQAMVPICDRQDIPLAEPLRLTVPPEAITEQALADGKVALHFVVENPQCGWTMFPEAGLALSDGVKTYPALPREMPNAYNYGRIASGEEFVLEFPLPESYDRSRPLELLIQNGIVSWEVPQGRFDLSIWQGTRILLTARVDRMNRTYRLTAAVPEAEVAEYIWEIPGLAPVTTATPSFKQRLDRTEPFEVKMTAVMKDGSRNSVTTQVVPQETTVAPPLEDGQVLVGLCFYDATPDADKTQEQWDATDKSYNWEAPRLEEKHYSQFYIREFVKDGLGNLAVFWPKVPNLPFEEELELVRELADQGIYTMTIYQYREPEAVRQLIEAGRNKYFLTNNIGEYAGYLYQEISSANACGIPQEGDLKECRDYFTDRFIGEGTQRYYRSYPYIFSTSGSTLANYELEGGIDFISGELYAVGAQNLAYSTGEMRGAARKWQPEFWAGWLAEEWQTFPVPYQSDQKYRLLQAGLYQQYLMGTSIIVLESGSQTTQAGFYTAESGKRNYAYDEEPPRRYRETMKEFYDFVKREGRRASGTPRTDIAVALGNCDSYVGIYVDWFVAWAQYLTAEKDPNWKYGDPERTNLAAQQVLFPLAENALAPYPNYWLAGSPYGQADVVGIEDLTRLSDLERYRFIAYSGWNSMTPAIFQVLNDYVDNGGTLFLSLPHLSTRLDREYTNYAVKDLIYGGDLNPLLSARVTGRQPVSGRVAGGPADGLTLKDEPIAAVELGDAVEVVGTVDGKPFLVKQKHGKGEVWLLLSWGYPGKESLADGYRAILGNLADRFKGDVYLSAEGDTLDYLSYAVYDDRVYLLNLDCIGPRSFVLHLNGKEQALTLEPAEMKTIHF